jgi:hypothetical protein
MVLRPATFSQDGSHVGCRAWRGFAQMGEGSTERRRPCWGTRKNLSVTNAQVRELNLIPIVRRLSWQKINNPLKP